MSAFLATICGSNNARQFRSSCRPRCHHKGKQNVPDSGGENSPFPPPVYLTTDLNPVACRSTRLTARTNSQPHIEALNTDLTASLSDRLAGQVDVLVFNPPYVETEEEEAATAQRDALANGIEKTWAGGAGGMTVTNRLLTQVKVRFIEREVGKLSTGVLGRAGQGCPFPRSCRSFFLFRDHHLLEPGR